MSKYSQAGTSFQQMVWRELLKIKKGQLISYQELAKRIGRPKAARAVANAVGQNKLAPIVPCHRVIRSDGSIGGYSAPGGIKTKIKLLKSEGVDISEIIGWK